MHDLVIRAGAAPLMNNSQPFSLIFMERCAQLSHLIQELAAQDYIHLRGHGSSADLSCYQAYHYFSVGDLLTLDEAAGAGLALLGFESLCLGLIWDSARKSCDKLVQLLSFDLGSAISPGFCYDLASSSYSFNVQKLRKADSMEIASQVKKYKRRINSDKVLLS